MNFVNHQVGSFMSQDKLTQLLQYVRENGRVCPNPQEWNLLWEMLPDKKRDGNGWIPPLPLILAAWSEPALYKILRLQEHIQYAVDNLFLDQVDEYLRSLRPEQWYTLK